MGSLMYAMLCTRSDLSQTVSMVNRYMHDSFRGHWEAVKWILRYIKETIDVGLVFEKDTNGKQELPGMLTMIMQETLTSTGLRWDMSSHYPKH